MQNPYINFNMEVIRSPKIIIEILNYNHACLVFIGCLTTRIFANVTKFALFSALDHLIISRLRSRPRFDLGHFFYFFFNRRLIYVKIIKTVNNEMDWWEEVRIVVNSFYGMSLVNRVVTFSLSIMVSLSWFSNTRDMDLYETDRKFNNWIVFNSSSESSLQGFQDPQPNHWNHLHGL